MGPPERLNLSWDGFEANARDSFRKFRDERELFDVTVVADCGKQVEANKVVLAVGSSFLHKILKENPHPHPLIYLNGVGYKHLLYLLDFVYTGETNIVGEDDLNDFLDIAHDLNVKGLTRHGTLETRSNQTASLASPLNQEAAKEPRPSPRVSYPHCVTSAAPASDYDQVAAEKHGPSLTMLRQARSQSITSTSPAPHPSQVLAQELRPPAVSQLHNVKSALPQGQVADDKTVLSPHSANSAFPQGQPAANETVPSFTRSNPHIPKSVLSQDKLVPSLGIQSLCSAISSHLNNASSQSSCEENHDNTFNVKVETGEGEHYSVVCGANDRGEQYICHVSSRGLEENGGNINFDEDTDGIVLSAEQELNDQVISTGKEPKEEIMESRNGMVIKEAADVVMEDEQLNHDWYEQGEETENMMLGWNKEDKNMISDRGQVLADKTKFSQDTDFQCFLCSITFTTSSQLRRHKVSHMDENKFPRPVRSQMGSSNKQDRIDAEEEQVKSNHTGDKPYQRFLSSKNNSLRKNLNQHKMIQFNRQKMTRTQDKAYQCVQCPKSFSRLDHLKQHKMTHTGEKPHHCVQCPKSFSRLENLKQHKMTHTGEKPHQCAQCPKSFTKLENLKQHKMTHTGEKPHQCVECPKSFSLLQILKRHKMTHTGEKPHQCVQCPKSFPRLNDLKRHKMTHTGEKPHQCVECRKSFSQLHHLKRHKMTHTAQ